MNAFIMNTLQILEISFQFKIVQLIHSSFQLLDIILKNAN